MSSRRQWDYAILSILKKTGLNVKDYLICTDLSIVGISNDGIIEAIEDKNKRFFIGVQWHPESMIEYDSIQNKIFKKFINACQNK